MEKLSFTKKNVEFEAKQVLKGCEMLGMDTTNGIGVKYVVQYKGSKIFVFETYETAQKFIDTMLKKFLEEHPQNVIPMFRQYLKVEYLDNLINEKKLFNHIKSKYDEMVGNQFSKFNKEQVLEEIKKSPFAFLKAIVKNEAQLSAFIFPILDLNEIIEALSDGMEFRVYEHGSFYYVPEVKLGN